MITAQGRTRAEFASWTSGSSPHLPKRELSKRSEVYEETRRVKFGDTWSGNIDFKIQRLPHSTVHGTLMEKIQEQTGQERIVAKIKRRGTWPHQSPKNSSTVQSPIASKGLVILKAPLQNEWGKRIQSDRQKESRWERMTHPAHVRTSPHWQTTFIIICTLNTSHTSGFEDPILLCPRLKSCLFSWWHHCTILPLRIWTRRKHVSRLHNKSLLLISP